MQTVLSFLAANLLLLLFGFGIDYYHFFKFLGVVIDKMMDFILHFVYRGGSFLQYDTMIVSYLIGIDRKSVV